MASDITEYSLRNNLPTENGMMQTQSDKRTCLPSMQPSLGRHRSIEAKHSTSIRKRESKRTGTTKTLPPPISGAISTASLTVLITDSDTEGEEMTAEMYYNKIQQVKSMMSSLTTKRQARSQIALPSKPMSATQRVQFEKKRLRMQYNEAMVNLDVWKGAYKEIEGHFGSAVVSYFKFLKWLFWLNLLLAVLLLAFIMIPQEVLTPRTFVESVNASRRELDVNVLLAYNSSLLYANHTSHLMTLDDQVIDFFQGTGWMESTVLFYGYYFNKTSLWLGQETYTYNMPLGYLLTVLAYFLLSLVAMVRYTAHSVKDSIVHKGDKFYRAWNKVFCGWDYNLMNKKGAQLHHKRLHREYEDDMLERKRREKLAMMRWQEHAKYAVIRVVANVLVAAIWVGCGVLIIYTSNLTNEFTTIINKDVVTNNAFLTLLVQFLPSITLTGLNMIVPAIFQKIVLFEHYKPESELRITIFRTVLLRLASVFVLIASLSNQVRACGKNDVIKDCSHDTYEASCCCWETYVGQQFYKLVLLDFIVVTAVPLVVEFPRKVLVKRFGDQYKVLEKIGYQEFQIPKNVLDLVYSQTLCWMGALFSPLIPAMTVLKFLIYFYLKKTSLLRNCIPSSVAYRASRSNSFFMTTLLISFAICSVPIVFTITKLPPSRACGPFRVHSSDTYAMWTALPDGLRRWPVWIDELLHILNSWVFYLPAIFVLAFVIYYFSVISSGYRRQIELHKQQLVAKDKNKQFQRSEIRKAELLNSVNAN